MSRGNHTIGYLEVKIGKTPLDIQKRFNVAECDMVIMGDDGSGRVYPIPKADAMKLAKEVNAFKRVLRTKMMAAAKNYAKGKR